MHLEDQETVIGEVDTLRFEEVGNVCEVGDLSVEVVLGCTVAVSGTGNDQFRIWDDFVSVVIAGVVDDVNEVDGYAALVQLLGTAVMDELGDLLQANLSCSLTENKEHGINDVGFPTSVGPDD